MTRGGERSGSRHSPSPPKVGQNPAPAVQSDSAESHLVSSRTCGEPPLFAKLLDSALVAIAAK